MNKIKELLLKGPLPTAGMLVARILVGGYLIYLSYSLIIGRSEGGINPAVLYIFTAIFFVVGAILLIKAIYSYIAGYYKGGKLDAEAADEEAVEEDVTAVEDKKSEIIDVDESEITELDK